MGQDTYRPSAFTRVSLGCYYGNITHLSTNIPACRRRSSSAHVQPCYRFFAPERTGAASGTHLILFHSRTVKRRSHHQRCRGCKQSFTCSPQKQGSAKGVLLVMDRTTHLNIKQDFTEKDDGKATNKLLMLAVRASPQYK